MILVKEIDYTELKANAQNLEKYSTQDYVIKPNRIHDNFTVNDTFVFLGFEGKKNILKKEVENIKISHVENEIVIIMFGNHKMCLEEISIAIELLHKCLPFKKLHPFVEWVYDDALQNVKADVIILKKRKNRWRDMF